MSMPLTLVPKGGFMITVSTTYGTVRTNTRHNPTQRDSELSMHNVQHDARLDDSYARRMGEPDAMSH